MCGSVQYTDVKPKALWLMALTLLMNFSTAPMEIEIVKYEKIFSLYTFQQKSQVNRELFVTPLR